MVCQKNFQPAWTNGNRAEGLCYFGISAADELVDGVLLSQIQ
jgi:hypothetical protein